MPHHANFQTSTHVFVHGSAGDGAQWRDMATLLPHARMIRRAA